MTTASHLRFFQNWRALAVAVATCVGLRAQSYDRALEDAERGSHYEGLASIASGGVQLRSARIIVDGPERGAAAPRSPGWGDRVRLRFYLPSEDRVTVTVRQLRSGSTYYLLDRVVAAWSTAECQ